MIKCIPKITTRTDKTHGIRRVVHRHRCSCGHAGKERWTKESARADQFEHERGMG